MNRIFGAMLAVVVSIEPAAAATRFGGPSKGAQGDTKKIGVAGGVQGKVLQQADSTFDNGTKERKIVGKNVASGNEMWLYDDITTDANSRLQVLLQDQTVFTLGPNGKMKLDEFVYDPKTNSGKVHAEISKGVFRFVTGKVAGEDPANMSIKLPVGTIGIRGTIGFGDVQGDKTVVGLGGPGASNNAGERPGGIEVTNEQGSVTITRPGWGTSVESGKAPTPPFPLPLNMLQQIFTQLNSAPPPQPAGGSQQGSSQGQSPGGQSGGNSGGSQTTSNSGGGTQSATESSGQSTASGIDTSEVAAYAGTTSGSNDTNTTHAAQDISTSQNVNTDITTWEQMASVAGFNGQGYYSGSSDFTRTLCASGPCNTTDTSAFSFNMTVNFGARTLNGNSSVFTGDSSLQDSASFNQSFGATGSAVISATGNQGVDYKFTFLNEGGPANKVKGEAAVANGTDTGKSLPAIAVIQDPNNNF
ncbi:MAG: FecR domain-containing protein [Elusimicrobia bacterium]|nr:FecR domain-containing protein [Elusimicrobiota bacterium]